MIRLLLFIHHIALCTPCIAHFDLASCLCIYARSRRAKIRNSSGVSAKGVWWSTSAKCEHTNIAFGSRQSPVHLTIILEFYLNLILFMILGCALGHRSWIDALVV
jgi:hypothetical protein